MPIYGAVVAVCGLGNYYITPAFAAKVQTLNNTVNTGISAAVQSTYVPLVDVQKIFAGIAGAKRATLISSKSATSIRPLLHADVLPAGRERRPGELRRSIRRTPDTRSSLTTSSRRSTSGGTCTFGKSTCAPRTTESGARSTASRIHTPRTRLLGNVAVAYGRAREHHGRRAILVGLDHPRHPEESRHAQIPGSVPCDGEGLASGEVVPFAKDEEIVLYCGSGNSCSRIAKALRDRGYRAIALEGGYQAWIDARLPTESRAMRRFRGA